MDRLADFGTSLETRRGEPFSSCVTSFTFAHSVVTHAQRKSNRGNEMCDNEMSFSMMPQLSIMKSRFAKASLRPRCARHRSGALPVCSPMVAWDTHLPNGCVGRQAFPMEAKGRLADFDPRQSARRFVSFITQG